MDWASLKDDCRTEMEWLMRHYPNELKYESNALPRAAEHAAKAGDLSMLEWIHANSDPEQSWHQELFCLMAASNGNVHVLEWAVMHDAVNRRLTGCRCKTSCRCRTPFYIYAAEGAATGGQLRALQWAVENDEDVIFPISQYKSIPNKAAQHGHWDLVDWWLQQGFPCDDVTLQCRRTRTKAPWAY